MVAISFQEAQQVLSIEEIAKKKAVENVISFPDDKEEAIIAEKKKNKLHEKIIKCMLLIPMAFAAFVAYTGFWLYKIIVYLKYDYEPKEIKLDGKKCHGLNNTNLYNNTDSGYSGDPLADLYPYLGLLSVALALAGIIRFINTACIFFRRENEAKHFDTFFVLHISIILATIFTIVFVSLHIPLQYWKERPIEKTYVSEYLRKSESGIEIFWENLIIVNCVMDLYAFYMTGYAIASLHIDSALNKGVEIDEDLPGTNTEFSQAV